MRVAGFNPFRPGRTLRNAPSRSLVFVTEGPEEQPAETDVVVVGGGVAGLAAAIHMRRLGLRVTLCEKGQVGAEQTSRALGWVSSLGDVGARFALSNASKRHWLDCSSNGLDVDYRRGGLVLACYSDVEADRFADWIDANRAESDARMVVGAEAGKLFNAGVPEDVHAVVVQRSDGAVDPAKVGRAFARAAIEAGVIVLQRCAVRGLERTHGRVSAAVTERGPIRTSAIVLAAGAWAGLFCRNLGIDIPILTVHSTLARTSPIVGGPSGCGAVGEGGWNAMPDGSYVFGKNIAVAPVVADTFRYLRHFLPALKDAKDSVSVDLDRSLFESLLQGTAWPLDVPGPFESNRVLASKPDPARSMEILRAMAGVMPAFAGAEIADCWGGVIDVTPDRVPIVSAVGSLPGLFLCAGFSGHGLAMAPAAAELVADLVCGRNPSLDPLPYRLDRFVQ